MFNFLNLGFEGYKKIATKDLRNARLLSRALEKTYFTVLSDVHRPIAANSDHPNDIDNPEHYEAGLPVVAFRLSDQYVKENPQVKQAWIQTMLKTKGWIVPNYNAPIGAEEVEILRVVVRETLSEDLIERFIIDILEITEQLTTTDGNLMLTSNSAHGLHHPDQEHGRPEKANFGDAQIEGGQEQTGFARQC